MGRVQLCLRLPFAQWERGRRCLTPAKVTPRRIEVEVQAREEGERSRESLRRRAETQSPKEDLGHEPGGGDVSDKSRVHNRHSSTSEKIRFENDTPPAFRYLDRSALWDF